MSLTAGIIDQLFWINVFLVGFNMLPAFPMDGGRVLRALLALRLGPGRATHLAAQVGKGMAILFAVVGLLGLPPWAPPESMWIQPNIMLALVALFVWSGADAEARAMRTRVSLAGVSVAAVMVRRFAAVDPDETLGAVEAYARQTYQREFPVVVGRRPVGLLGRDDLRRGLHEFGPNGRVFQVMHRDFPTVSPEDPAERGLALLTAGTPAVPVVTYGQLAGMLTAEHLSEFISAYRHGPDEAHRDHEVG